MKLRQDLESDLKKLEKSSFIFTFTLPTLEMGNSSSKQPVEEVQQEEEQQAAPSSGNEEVSSEQPQAQDVMQEDEQPTIEDTDKQRVVITEETTVTATTQDGGDSFKIPSLPTSSTTTTSAPELPLSPNSASIKALPADIEHILSLGANKDELSKLNIADSNSAATGGSGEIDQVVKELREKYQQEGMEKVGADGELSQVEKEMKEKGILRNQENVVQAEDKMDQE